MLSEISTWFEFCKTLYDESKGKIDISPYVRNGAITKDQYKEITGKDYVDPNKIVVTSTTTSTTTTTTIKIAK